MPLLQSLGNDIRYALRVWRFNPGTTFAVFLALTIGIGGSTAIFSVVNAVLLSPLPVSESDRLVEIYGTDKQHPIGRGLLSMPDVLDWKRRLHSFQGIALHRNGLSILTSGGQPTLVQTLICDAQIFPLLGIKLVQGKPFTTQDNEPGRASSIVISWEFWQRNFGGKAAVGQRVRLDDRPFVIRGVLPKGLDIPAHRDVWLPAELDLANPSNGRGIHSFEAIGRLCPGVTLPEADAELSVAAAQLAAEHLVENKGVGAHAMDLREWLTGSYKIPLLMLQAGVLSVLLIACANVAHLLLARTSARLREISVRIAIGARPRDLFRQLMTESLLLSLSSASVGLLFTAADLTLIRRLPKNFMPRPDAIALDWRVLLFTTGVAVVTSLLFGLLPAVRSNAVPVATALKQSGGRITDSKHQQLLRMMLVMAEAMVASLLLVESLLLIQSFENAAKINPGFETSHLLTMFVSLPPSRYGQDSALAARFADHVLQRVSTISGVESAAFGLALPLASAGGEGPIQIEGRPAPPHLFEAPSVVFGAITPGYRKTMRIPLLQGRDFDQREDLPGASGVLINESLAKQFFGGENPLGRRLSYRNLWLRNESVDWHQVVGVVADAKQESLEKPAQPELYLPLYRSAGPWPAILIRTRGNPLNYTRAIQDQVAKVDPGVAVFKPRSMDQILSEQLRWRAFHTSLLSAFAASALLLASLGIFGVVAYSVTQRTSEIALRMACGASEGRILGMMLRQGMAPAIVGTILGTALALGVARYLEELLYDVRFTNPAAYAGAVAFLLLVAAAASYFPARRATKVDPWQALRYE